MWNGPAALVPAALALAALLLMALAVVLRATQVEALESLHVRLAASSLLGGVLVPVVWLAFRR